MAQSTINVNILEGSINLKQISAKVDTGAVNFKCYLDELDKIQRETNEFLTVLVEEEREVAEHIDDVELAEEEDSEDDNAASKRKLDNNKKGHNKKLKS